LNIDDRQHGSINRMIFNPAQFGTVQAMTCKNLSPIPIGGSDA
jgi:hypothetical protein